MKAERHQNVGAGAQITAEVTRWPGVERHPHPRGGTEFRLGKRELGHLHGNSLADLPFPRKIRDELVAAGRAHPHHILPDTGWVSFWIKSPDDVERTIQLFRLSYDRAIAARGRKEGA